MVVAQTYITCSCTSNSTGDRLWKKCCLSVDQRKREREREGRERKGKERKEKATAERESWLVKMHLVCRFPAFDDDD